jgi:hypothetical protein
VIAVSKRRLRELARADESRRRLTRVIKKAAELHKIRAGWYFGSGEPISPEAIGRAIYLIKLAHENGLWRSNVFPRAEGGVRIDFIQQGHEVEVSIGADTLCSATHDIGNETIASADEVPFDDAAAFLKTSARTVCSSEHSTQTTSTTKKADSVQLPASHGGMAVFQLSVSNAHLINRAHFTATSAPITRSSARTRRFFGGSTLETSPRTLIGASSKAQGTLTSAM